MALNEASQLPPPQRLSLPSLAHPLSRVLDLRPCRRIESDMRVWIRWVEFSDTKRGKEGFLFWGVDRSFGVARTFDTVLWENSDFFHKPKQHYEEFLELGDSLFPLMADSEINS